MTVHAMVALVAFLVIAEAAAAGQHAPHDLPRPVDLPTVQAALPPAGPKIWTFVKGDTTLRILGTVQPLPRSLKFDSDGIHQALQASDALLSGEGVVTGEVIGLFRGLRLLPAMRRIKHSASKQTLEEVLSPTEYTEWQRLSNLYLPGNTGVERMRPMYVASALYEAAIDRGRLDRHHSARATIAVIAKKLGIPLIDGRLHVRVTDPKEAISAFHIDTDEDLGCFREVLRSLPPWLEKAHQAGTEWSSGRYRGTPQAPPRCWSWLTNQAIASSQGIVLEQAARQKWLQSLQAAFRMRLNIFTTMPIDDLEQSKGLASALLSEGYTDITHGPSLGPTTESVRSTAAD